MPVPAEPCEPFAPCEPGARDPEPVEPNTGRILDYWLGGCHHFEADVTAAKGFDAVYPHFPRIFRVLRQYLARTTRFIRSSGIEQFLVLGAGIPTQGNVHEIVPGARVLYTDNDPLNVALGRKILAGIPAVDYAIADARDPGSLPLPSPCASPCASSCAVGDADGATELLDPEQRIGIIAIGLFTFLCDAELTRLFAALHAWASAGSLLAFDFDSDAVLQYPALRPLAMDGFHYRTPSRVLPLLGSWHLSEEGICPVARWGGCTDNADLPVFMYGGVARKNLGAP